MKKILKVVGIIVLIILALLITIPFVLEAKIDTIVRNYSENNLNADVDFDDISLSLLSSFPDAEFHVKNLKISNRAPFEGEILATAKDIAFEMPIGDFLKGSDEALVIHEISAEELLLTLMHNANGTTNYDIIKESKEQTTTETSDGSGFSFDIKNIDISNSAFTYLDAQNGTQLYLTEFNHQGKGVFSGSSSQLDTFTESRVSLVVDSSYYLENNSVKLNALIDMDFENSTYTFKENKAFVNALPLEFNGYVKILEDGQDINIDFSNPESSFKDFLAVIPEQYSKDIASIKTTGNFKVNGRIKGELSENSIPKFDISMISNKASFKYPDLPKGVEDIELDVQIRNTTGKTKDTYVDINTLNFRIDDDTFSSEAHIKELTEAVKVNAQLKGTLNLANMTKAYPIALDKQVSGLLKGDLETNFDMDAINNNAYERIKNKGQIQVTDFVFSSQDIVNPIQINSANLRFEPGLVNLETFDAQTGQSDFNATGTITNLLGFLLSDKDLKGNFELKSNKFVIADFMVEDQSPTEGSNKTSSDEESLKIPAFLNCNITADAKNVVYDNLNLNNVQGQLKIKDQTAQLSNMTADLFQGKIDVSGNVSTINNVPDFNLKLGINNFDIAQSFKDLQMLKAIAPIASVLEGKLNSTIDVSGVLNTDFAPELSSISGEAIAQILTSKVNMEKSPLLSSVSNALNFVDLKDLDLKTLNTALSFKDGRVVMQPFSISYKDIPIEISGTHSFSNTMNYNAVFQVPAKYLGSDVNRLIGQINDDEVNKIKIPVTATIAGTFSSPKVSTDLRNGVSELTKSLVEIQKQKLINQGKDKVGDILGGLLGGDKKSSTPSDSSKADVKSTVGSVLGGILGGKKGQKEKIAKDSTKNNKN